VGETSHWSGTLFFARQWALYRGPVGPTDAHTHRAHQVVVASPPLVMRDPCGGIARGGVASVVPAGVAHAIVEAHPSALVLYVECAGPWGRRISEPGVGHAAEDWVARGAALAPLTDRLIDAPPQNAADAQQATDALLDALGAAWNDNAPHPAVRAALAAIDETLPEAVRAPELAAACGLSASRLMHLFRQDLRISLRGHVRWARMRRALDALEKGASIGRAAHGAGFADAAHLSRVFRATFGIAPSVLARSVRWVLVDPP
jgi:AraC-like DNA-binding protein